MTTTEDAGPGAWSRACAAFMEQVRVGATVRLREESWTVVGRVLATDHEETWAECLLRSGAAEAWLAVETRTGVPVLSLWRRGPAAEMGFDPVTERLGGAALRQTGQGRADYVIEGDCDVLGEELPSSGELTYREYVDEESGGRVAATAFGPAGVLLVGCGSGLRADEFQPEGGDDWWSEFFGAIYTDSDIEYQDPVLTEAMVACVGRLVPVGGHPRLLDLACGTGRHAVPLAAAGYRVTGADLSADYLRQAGARAAAAGRAVDLVRTDMRDLSVFPDGSFDAVTNLHTSFGFFHDAADDQRVLDEVRRVLAPGGRLLIDVINRDAFLRQTSEVFGVPEDQFTIRTFDTSTGRTFLHEEVFDPLTSRIRWTVTEPGPGGRSSTADYRVFSAHELLAMVRAAGLVVESVHGDYELSPFTVHSPSIVCLASAPTG
ncbi:DUF4178 domain-containing protein [Kitasatospora sp. McL0602]|uniref:DUF4178 domain-containing protein n=1 Tax=Kitasatospora sp. McL0602 TaxID=3439530 RepID=UPI003F8B67D7